MALYVRYLALGYLTMNDDDNDYYDNGDDHNDDDIDNSDNNKQQWWQWQPSAEIGLGTICNLSYWNM